MVFAFGENWSAMGVLRFVVIRRPLCYLTLHRSGSSGAMGAARGEEEGPAAAGTAAHLDHYLRLETRTRADLSVWSRLHVEGFCRRFFQSTGAPANASMLAPGSPSHIARKGSGSDVRRTRSASRHKCEPSSSSSASSILTEPSVPSQTGHVESWVPLSLCLRMNLRGCGAAKEWPL
jgi:hypothetical protein